LIKLQRILITKTPVAFFLKKSKHWYLPGFEGVAFYDVLRFFYMQIKTHGLSERAAAVAYNFIMAIPPSLLFLFTLIPNLPFISKRSIQTQLHGLIVDIVPSKIYNKELLKFVDSFIYGNKIGLLSFGLLLSLFFASNAMMGLIRSFNRKYVGFERIKGLKKRWMALKLTTIIFALVLGYFSLLISQGALLRAVVTDKGWRQVIDYTRWILILSLIFFAIGFIFKYATPVQKKWKLASPGTIIATCLCVISTLVFSTFVNSFGRYNVLYGSIGTIMVVMAMIYINSLAILIGFELNVSIKSLKAISLQRELEEKAVAT
jgi:membrane protein